MKKELRLHVLSLLKDQSKETKKDADAWLTNELLKSSFYKKAHVIATYISLEHEFETVSFIEAALRDGKRVCVPKTYPKGRMEFMEYNPENLQKTHFGLMEPGDDALVVDKEDIDLIHVPGLVFNSQGYRIGYGGGYYDRYLVDFKGKTVSTIYAFQLGEFAVRPYDIAVEEVLMV